MGYSLSKKAKAAADVDYPAYGVTGPNVDISGDKKLAQSAHMYHYQHQKQQIIAMERNDMDRNGSVSDPESEEENEEGDYTVYECPGFATTGDMEVKNPLFKEGATPGTPAAKSDEEKVKPKE
ncbi:jg22142 [Pararge aegeria aegeria]|uniref:Jg22142 protein n=1 Tax=Pararge aegeria aegeria TaxID=348720 RepID=A0A8S4S8T8_9NEOP|nr:jg22142 [Pararge aegeria aegeria]